MGELCAAMRRKFLSIPNGDKRMNVAEFELDRGIGTVDLIILADATYQANWHDPY